MLVSFRTEHLSGEPTIERRENRRYMVGGLGIHAKSMFNTVVEVLELGVGGAVIKGSQRFLVGCEYNLIIERENTVIPVKGVIVWKRVAIEKAPEGGMIPVETAAVAFVDVLADKAEELKVLLADKIRELKDLRLNGVSAKMQPAEKAEIGCMERCRIQDIGLGGLRMETEKKLPADMIFALELVFARNERSIHCRGRVAFCREAAMAMSKRYSVGVEFRDLSERDAVKIERFIETLS
jgi:hypothetical protein